MANDGVFSDNVVDQTNSGGAPAASSAPGTTHQGDTAPSTTASPFQDLVGEGRKYRTLEDFRRSFDEKEQYIKQLEEENHGMRGELRKMDNNSGEIKALMDEIRTSKNSPSDSNTTSSGDQLTKEDIAELVLQSITQVEQDRTASQNVNNVNEELIKRYGDLDKASEAVKSLADTIGLPVQTLKQTAAQSPSAFYKLMGIDTAGGAAPVSNISDQAIESSVNNSAPIPGQQVNPGSKAEFDKIRKEDPKRYWTADVQNAIFQSKKAGTYD